MAVSTTSVTLTMGEIRLRELSKPPVLIWKWITTSQKSQINTVLLKTIDLKVGDRLSKDDM